MQVTPNQSGEQAQRRLAMPTMHHMPGQTDLGRVPTKVPTNSPETDAFEVGDFVSGWTSAVIGDQLVPLWVGLAKQWFPDDKYPIFAGTYGNIARTRTAIFAANTAADLISGPLQNAVRSLLHGWMPQIAGAPAESGFGLTVTPANEMAASLVKTVATGIAKSYLTTAFAPKPPPPPPPPTTPPAAAPDAKAPATAPDAKAAGRPGVAGAIAAAHKPGNPGAAVAPQSASIARDVAPDAATGPMFLGHDIKELANETASYGLSLMISKTYDQTVGPMVQRAVNGVMGKHVEVAKAKPMTPGGIASALAGSFLSSLLLRPVAWPAGGPTDAIAGAAGFGSVLSTAMVNGLISTAFDNVYGRSVGPAINDAVNGMAGIEKAQRAPQTFTGERLVRSMARSTASATTYYLTDALTRTMFTQLGSTIGGPVGAFVAMAGSALLGMTVSTVADAVIGGTIGSAAGSVYSWITGKPKSEARPPEPAKPADVPAAGTPAAGTPAAAPAATPAAPVAPAAPGTPPAAAPAAAGAAPVATTPMRRRAPGAAAAAMTPEQLAAIAVAA